MSKSDISRGIYETAQRQLSQEGFALFSATVWDEIGYNLSRKQLKAIKNRLQELAYSHPKPKGDFPSHEEQYGHSPEYVGSPIGTYTRCIRCK